jgi:hypothetical protein
MQRIFSSLFSKANKEAMLEKNKGQENKYIKRLIYVSIQSVCSIGEENIVKRNIDIKLLSSRMYLL